MTNKTGIEEKRNNMFSENTKRLKGGNEKNDE